MTIINWARLLLPRWLRLLIESRIKRPDIVSDAQCRIVRGMTTVVDPVLSSAYNTVRDQARGPGAWPEDYDYDEFPP